MEEVLTSSQSVIQALEDLSEGDLVARCFVTVAGHFFLRVWRGGSVLGFHIMVTEGGGCSGREGEEGADILFLFVCKMQSHVWLIFKPPFLLRFSLRFLISSASRISRALKFFTFASKNTSIVMTRESFNQEWTLHGSQTNPA
jgi:hypothetical protein